MEELDLNDERIRELLNEELDRREKEKQNTCNHRRAGTMLSNHDVRCDDCGKILDEKDLENAYTDGDDTPSSVVNKLKVKKDADL